MNKAPDDIVPVSATLGEGVIWDHRAGEALWTDILGKRFFAYNPDTKALCETLLERRLTAFGLSDDPNWLIAAFDTGFAWFHPARNEILWIEQPEKEGVGRRFNDGRIGPDGRFWCGTMVEDRDKAGADSASLFCLDASLAVKVHFSGVSISNGIAFSPDAKVMYFADSPKRTVWRFEFDAASGVLSNREVFIETPEGAYPDGAAVDAEGGYWSALWGASRVERYTPDGKIDHVIETPVSQPSCVAFGGPDLDTLFVTTAQEDLSAEQLGKEPHAGDLLIYKTDFKGLASSVFAGSPPSGEASA